MKILVFSDTHGKINSVIEIIEQHKNVDLIIHLGDLVRDAYDIESVVNIPVEYVAGNNDFFMDVPKEKIIEASGKRIFLTHGHNYSVRYTLEQLIREAKNRGVDIMLFGHTHQPYQDTIDNILYFNPGSTRYSTNGPTYGLIEIIDNKIYSMVCQKNNS